MTDRQNVTLWKETWEAIKTNNGFSNKITEVLCKAYVQAAFSYLYKKGYVVQREEPDELPIERLSPEDMPDTIYAYHCSNGTGTWVDFDDSCEGDVAVKYVKGK